MKLCGLTVKTAKQVIKDANIFLRISQIFNIFRKNEETSYKTFKFGFYRHYDKNKAVANITDVFREIKSYILEYGDILIR